MQLSNALLALGGDRNNTVPKGGITPAEIEVMRMIHGGDAVFDIEPLDAAVRRSNGEEISRLARFYPAKDEDGNPIVRRMYPNAGAYLPASVEELNLDESLFKVLQRVTAAPMPKAKAPARKKVAEPLVAPPVTDDASHMFSDEGGDDLREDDPAFAAIAS